jgi:hypothetical protein
VGGPLTFAFEKAGTVRESRYLQLTERQPTPLKESKGKTYMRRAISTAYCATFHLFIEDFVQHRALEDQRARLGRMFNHGPMRNASFTPKKKNGAGRRSKKS